MSEIKGWHVLSWFVIGFGIIIAVNLTLAFNAVRTFPGIEVKNSYVASQSFDADRSAQLALGWTAAATLEGGRLRLTVTEAGQPIAPVVEDAVFGRATTVADDQRPDFTFDGDGFVARVDGGAGNWNLRVRLRAKDGTLFQQRVIVEVVR